MRSTSVSRDPSARTPATDAAPRPIWSATLRPLGRTADPELWRDWSALTRRAPWFLRPEFAALASRLVDGEPLVAAVYRDGALAGALPLVRNGRALGSLHTSHAPEYDLVGEPECVEAIWRALVAEGGWDRLILRQVPAASPLATCLARAALRDLAVTVMRPESRSPYLVLPGFEARLSSKLRQNLRRTARKAGAIELERITRFSRPALEEAFALEAMAWKGAAGTSVSARPEVHHLHLAMARLAARRGELSLYFLRVSGRRVACLLAIEDERVLHALRVGHDPSVSELTPGQLLFAEVARDAEQRGLVELDFGGNQNEWKRRWTSLTRDQVALVAYRPTLRGGAALLVNEVIEPRLPRLVAIGQKARDEIAARRSHCQNRDLIGVHSRAARVLDRVRSGLGVRSGLDRILASQEASEPLGAPSAFAPAQWVRVLDADRMRGLLDERDKHRGLKFIPAQWATCGQVYRVDRSVRRLADDRGQMRRVSRTVLLEGVTCDEGDDRLGCGRHCPLMFRDEWLEPAAAPEQQPARSVARWARVRSLSEIRATLDRAGRRDGLIFMAEMAGFAGQRLPVVRQLPRIFELDHWTRTRAPIYVLEGARCRGEALGELGPCHRACSLLWHGDWLALEPPSAAAA